MRQVQRLRAGQMLSGSEQGREIVEQGRMVGRAPFVGCPSLEEDGVPTLPLQVQHGCVPLRPVGRREGAALEHDAHRELRLHVAFGTDVAPQAQVEDE